MRRRQHAAIPLLPAAEGQPAPGTRSRTAPADPPTEPHHKSAATLPRTAPPGPPRLDGSPALRDEGDIYPPEMEPKRGYLVR
jgi:hypothetical protein